MNTEPKQWRSICTLTSELASRQGKYYLHKAVIHNDSGESMKMAFQYIPRRASSTSVVKRGREGREGKRARERERERERGRERGGGYRM
jgi:hypothetical protein